MGSDDTAETHRFRFENITFITGYDNTEGTRHFRFENLGFHPNMRSLSEHGASGLEYSVFNRNRHNLTETPFLV